MNQSGVIENSKFIRLNFFNGPDQCSVEPVARINRRTAPTLQPQAGKSGQGRDGGIRSRFRMNKRALIKKIVARLTDELEVYVRAAQASRAEATHEQSKPENKYDTRGLEASYLARGQSRQAAEIQAAIAAFEKLDARKFGAGEPIDVGAFVELAFDGEKTAYFIGPRAGGTEVLHEKREVLVITPQSPLGEQLLGRKQGDILKLKLADAQNQYRVTAVV